MMKRLFFFYQVLWSSVRVISIPHLATHNDFKHKSYILNYMLHGKQIKDLSEIANEVNITNHEVWWLKEPLKRHVAVPVSIYISDTSELMETMYKHTHWGCTDELAKEFANKTSFFIENTLSSFSTEQKLNKPYLCKQSEYDNKDALTPYRFTVLGDSHASIFEVAALRIKHMNVTTIEATSMYGLKNMTSFNTRIFQDVIKERGHVGSEESGENVLVFNLGDVDIHSLGWRKYLYNETEGVERSLRVFGEFLKDNVELPGGYDKVVVVLAPPPTYRNNTQAHLHEIRIDYYAEYEDRIKSIAKFNEALRLFCSQRSHCAILDIFPKIWGQNSVFRPYVNWVKPDIHLQPQRMFGLMLEQLRSTLDAKWCIDDDISEGPQESSDNSGDFPINIPANDPIGFEPVLIMLNFDIEGVGCNFIINAVHYLTTHELAVQIAAGRFVEFKGDQIYFDKFLKYFNQGPSVVTFLGKKLSEILGEGWGELNRKLTVDEEFRYVSIPMITQKEVMKTSRLATHEDFKHKGIFQNFKYESNITTEELSPDFKYELDITDHEEWWMKEPVNRFLKSPMPIYVSDTSELTDTIYLHRKRERCESDNERKFAKEGSAIIDSVLSSYSNEDRMKKPYLCKQSEHDKDALTPYRFTVLGDSHSGIFEIAALRTKNMNVTTVVSASMYGLKNMNSFSGAARIFKQALNERRQVGNQEVNVLVFNLGDVDIHGHAYQKYLYNETEGVERSLRVFGEFLKDNVEIPGGYDKVVVVLPPPPGYKNLSFGRVHYRRPYQSEDLTYEDVVKSIAKFNEELKWFCSQRSYCSVLDIFPKVWGSNGVVFRPYVNWVRPDTHLVPQRIFGVMLEQLRSTLDAKWCIEVDSDESQYNSDGGEFSVDTAANDQLGFEPVLAVISFGIDGVLCNFIINAVHYLNPHELAVQIAAGKYIEYEGTQEGQLDKLLLFLNQGSEGLEFMEKKLTEFLGEGWGKLNRKLIVDEEFRYVSIPMMTQQEVLKTSQLATHKDFKHKGYFRDLMIHHLTETKLEIDKPIFGSEIEVTDHEVWWLEKPLQRYLSVPFPFYIGDDAKLFETSCLQNNVSSAEEDRKTLAKTSAEYFETTLSSYSTEERLKKPYLCQEESKHDKDTLTPFMFTVLGDSHSGIFEIAALRTKNMNVTTVVSASMYGLKNMNSSSGAARIFKQVLNERRQVGNQEVNVLVFNLGDVDIHGHAYQKYLYNETEGVERSLRVFGEFLKEHVEIPGGYDKIVVVLPPPPAFKNLKAGRMHWVRSYRSEDLTYEDVVKSIAKFNEELKWFCSQRSYCSVLDIFPKVWGSNGVVFRPYVNWVRPNTHLVPQRTFGVMLEQLRSTLDAKWCIEVDSEESQYSSDGGEFSVDIAANEPLGFEPVLVMFHFYIEGVVCHFVVNAVHYLTPHELAIQIAAGRFIEFRGDQRYLVMLLEILNHSPENIQALEKSLNGFLGEGWGELNRKLIVDEDFHYVSIPMITQQEVVKTTRLATHEDFELKGFFMNRLYHHIAEVELSPLFQSEVDIIDHELWWLEEPLNRYLELPMPIYLGDNSNLSEVIFKHKFLGFKNLDPKEFVEETSSTIDSVLSSYSNEERMKKPYLCKQSEHDDKDALTPYRFTVLGDSHSGIFEIAALRTKNMNVTTIEAASMYGLKNMTSFSGAARIFKQVLNERRQVGNQEVNVLVFNLGDVDIHGHAYQKYLYNETEGVERSLRVFGEFLKDNVEILGGYDKVVVVLPPPPGYKNLHLGRVHYRRLYQSEDLTYEDVVKSIAKFNEELKWFCSQRSYCSVLDIFPKVWGSNGVFRPYLSWVRPDTHLVPQRTFGVMLEQLRSTLDAKWCIDDDTGEESQEKSNGDVLPGSIATNHPIGFEPVLMVLPYVVQGIQYNFFINAVHYLTPYELTIQIAAGRYIYFLGDQSYLDKLLALYKYYPGTLLLLEKKLNDFLGEGWGELNRKLIVDEDFHYVSIPTASQQEVIQDARSATP